MVRQSHFIAVRVSFLMGCAGLLIVVGCAGVRSEASQEEQGRTEATMQEQGHTQATKDQYGSEEARCSQTRTYRVEDLVNRHSVFTTNDVPGCPQGGLLSGTDGDDNLEGQDGDDEIHGLGAGDSIEGGDGNDVIYGGAGNDWLYGYGGEDVLYGGDGNDALDGIDEWPKDTQRDELYCGPGKDVYDAGKLDYVDSSCEKKEQLAHGL